MGYQFIQTKISKYISSIVLYICIGTDQLTFQKVEYFVTASKYYATRNKPYVNTTNPHKLSVNNRFMTLSKQQKRPWSKSKHESKIKHQ